MHVIVITGGIASGKSTACEHLQSKGAVVISTDAIAHGILASNPGKRDELVKAFGSGILDSAGHIDRKALAAIVFRDPQATSRLNAITHPAILRELSEGVAALRLLQSPPEVVIVEIPLLAEAPAFAEVADTVLAIEAPERDRVERALLWGRDEGDIRRRVALQATDAERSSLADTVIVNDGSKEELLGKLDEYWELVTSRGA